MTITLDITKSVAMGQKPVLNVAVMNLNAASDEIAFASDLTKAVVEFAEKYGEKSVG